jgi:tRNA-dihydrouridine synthase
MIGRASIGYPWIFRDIKQYLADGTIPEATHHRSTSGSSQKTSYEKYRMERRKSRSSRNEKTLYKLFQRLARA